MKMRSWIGVFLAGFSTLGLGRDTLESIQFLGTPSSHITVGAVSVPIYRQARLKYPGSDPEGGLVFLTGAGIRRKKIAFIDVDVYVITSYSALPVGLVPTSPLESLNASPYEALVLTMVRDVSAEQIRSSFEDSLDSNGIDFSKPGIRDLLKRINFDMPITNSVLFLAYSDEGTESVLTETTLNHLFVTTDQGLGLDFWKIWFGKPVDKFMEKLKAKLVGGN